MNFSDNFTRVNFSDNFHTSGLKFTPIWNLVLKFQKGLWKLWKSPHPSTQKVCNLSPADCTGTSEKCKLMLQLRDHFDQWSSGKIRKWRIAHQNNNYNKPFHDHWSFGNWYQSLFRLASIALREFSFLVFSFSFHMKNLTGLHPKLCSRFSLKPPNLHT